MNNIFAYKSLISLWQIIQFYDSRFYAEFGKKFSKMKVFAILVCIAFGICVAFAAETPLVQLPCCPNPPIRFGIGPVCRDCDPIPPCCPEPPLNPKFGHGPVCTPCKKPTVSEN